MDTFVNMSEIFVETHNEYIAKYKKGNGQIETHTAQKRYIELLTFVETSCYWSRYNIDNRIKKKKNNRNKKKYVYKKNVISGKYLNEIHLFYVKYGFYEILYKKLLNMYLELTNYETLHTISQDSMFVRSILLNDSDRNPQYYNKPGIKVHVITDSQRTVISIVSSSCVDHDSQFIGRAMTNKLITDATFHDNVDTFLADSAYSTSDNLTYLTNLGVNVIMGRNKQHINKTTNINKISTTNKITYKKRIITENFFSNIERYPCLINVYERKEKSYMGLFMFTMCTMLAKKINIIIAGKKKRASKKEKENMIRMKKEAKDKKRKEAEQKRLEKRKEALAIKKIKRLEKEKKEKAAAIIQEKISNIIRKKINSKIIKKAYEKKEKTATKKISYKNFEKKAMDNIIKYIKHNVLMQTEYLNFANKKSYIISVKKHAFNDANIEKTMNAAKDRISKEIYSHAEKCII